MVNFSYEVINGYTEGGETMNRIRAIRVKKKLSQVEVARSAGISQPYLCDLENNRRGAKPETYKRIADVLEVPVNELCEVV